MDLVLANLCADSEPMGSLDLNSLNATGAMLHSFPDPQNAGGNWNWHSYAFIRHSEGWGSSGQLWRVFVS